jgi:hypothetical protein
MKTVTTETPGSNGPFRLFARVLVLLVLCYPTLCAQQGSGSRSIAKHQAVYIVAVKKNGGTDTELMRQLHRRLSKGLKAQVNRRIDSSVQSERQTLERPVPFIVPGADADEDLKAIIEEQFIKQRKFRIVDSAEKADFVFLVQGEYIFAFERRVPGGRNSVALGRAGLQGEADTLARLKAIAIPSSAYRERPSRNNMARMLQNAVWRGEETGYVRGFNVTFDEASPKNLIKRFHKDTLEK